MLTLLTAATILIFAILNTLGYIYLKRWYEAKLQLLLEKEEEINEDYEKQANEIEYLKQTERKLRNQLHELKTQKKNEENENIPDGDSQPQRPEDLLLQENIISLEQLTKAKKYMENNQQAGMGLIDILMILGFIDSKTAEYAKNKSRQAI